MVVVMMLVYNIGHLHLDPNPRLENSFVVGYTNTHTHCHNKSIVNRLAHVSVISITPPQFNPHRTILIRSRQYRLYYSTAINPIELPQGCPDCEDEELKRER